jgi:hypothetical protein
MTNADIIPVLQTAIGPVILISGVGLLLLTMTNRLARTVDRARVLGAREGEARQRAQGQLLILIRRARILRASILLASTSALLSAVLVMALFITALLGTAIGGPIAVLFIADMSALIASLVLFIGDVNLSLSALHAELHR